MLIHGQDDSWLRGIASGWHIEWENKNHLAILVKSVVKKKKLQDQGAEWDSEGLMYFI